ncbi:MAG: hypothetical protein HEQ35_05735 [Gloeotrichia echinulata IR180]
MTSSKYDFARFRKLIRRIHNTRITASIGKAQTKAKKSLLEYAMIEPDDTAQMILNKQMYYWLTLGGLRSTMDVVPIIPEWWPVRVGADRAQLLIVFKSNQNSRTYNRLCIPHYSGSKINKSPLSSYKRGNYRGCLTLKDNSKFICYASSESEAESVINEAKRHIRDKFLINSSISIGTTRKKTFSTDTMVPILAKYFSKGQGQLTPDWQSYF